MNKQLRATVEAPPDVMSNQEAITWKRQVGGAAHELRRLLAEGYERRAWIALGYAGWRECLLSISEEFQLSERHLYRLHAANTSAQALTHGSDVQNLDTIPERVLRPLSRLSDDDDKRAAWQLANEFAGGQPTARQVDGAVKTIVYSRRELGNGVVECSVCGEMYDGSGIEFCPYCAFTSDERIAYLRTGEQPRPPQPHVANNSGNNEWYTPPEYIEAARAVMGEIDTDPASSAIANETVQARIYFTEADNGLAQPWRGRVWMNPPYAQPAIGEFCTKLAAELAAGRVYEAITLTNNATETGWFRTLSAQCAAVCFPAGRIRFLDTSGAATGAPLQGQAVMYFGQNVARFANEFGEFGQVFYAR